MQFDFTSWLSRFWLGNFDLILSSSVLAYNLMSPVNSRSHLASHCSKFCDIFSNIEFKSSSEVRVEVFRLATNKNWFHSGASDPAYVSDVLVNGVLGERSPLA